jgi:glutathione S-transferase
MIQLHYCPSNASMIPHIVLEELGVPFELVLVDRAVGAHKSDAYLKLNPNGLIPTLVMGDLVLYECAAICLHLSDLYPKANLAPATGSAARAHFYKWLVWLTNTLQPALIMYFYPERYVASGNTAGAAEVKAAAQQKIGDLLEQLDDELARVKLRSKATVDVSGMNDWFMGTQYTVLDAYVFTLCRWTRGFKDRPARSFAHLGEYLQRMLARPAVQRVLAKEQIAPPLI